MDLDRRLSLLLRHGSSILEVGAKATLELPGGVNPGSLFRVTRVLLGSLGRMVLQDYVDSLGTEGSLAPW